MINQWQKIQSYLSSEWKRRDRKHSHVWSACTKINSWLNWQSIEKKAGSPEKEILKVRCASSNYGKINYGWARIDPTTGTGPSPLNLSRNFLQLPLSSRFNLPSTLALHAVQTKPVENGKKSILQKSSDMHTQTHTHSGKAPLSQALSLFLGLLFLQKFLLHLGSLTN